MAIDVETFVFGFIGGIVGGIIAGVSVNRISYRLQKRNEKNEEYLKHKENVVSILDEIVGFWDMMRVVVDSNSENIDSVKNKFRDYSNQLNVKISKNHSSSFPREISGDLRGLSQSMIDKTEFLNKETIDRGFNYYEKDINGLCDKATEIKERLEKL